MHAVALGGSKFATFLGHRFASGSTMRLAGRCALAAQAQACYVSGNDHPRTVEKWIVGRNVRIPGRDPVSASVPPDRE